MPLPTKSEHSRNSHPSAWHQKVKFRMGEKWGQISLIYVLIIMLSYPIITSYAEEKINLHYIQRPPYSYKHGDDVVGLTATIAGNAFREAEIPFSWKKTPFKRQLMTFKGNKGKDCGCCPFKTSDREQFAKYTKSLYQDKPQVAIAKASNTKIKSGIKVEDIMKNQSVILLVKGGYSYGPFLDKLIESYDPNRSTVTVENYQMLKMIYLRRGDYFFIAEEEATSLIQSAGFQLEDFKLIHFSEMPPGNKRYIMCSRQVHDSIIQRLNQHLP